MERTRFYEIARGIDTHAYRWIARILKDENDEIGNEKKREEKEEKKRIRFASRAAGEAPFFRYHPSS